MKTETLSNKIELIQWLSSIEDESLIQKLMEFRRRETGDWWKEISIAEKNSIEKGIREANENMTKPHSEARKIYEKWL